MTPVSVARKARLDRRVGERERAVADLRVGDAERPGAGRGRRRRGSARRGLRRRHQPRELERAILLAHEIDVRRIDHDPLERDRVREQIGGADRRVDARGGSERRAVGARQREPVDARGPAHLQRGRHAFFGDERHLEPSRRARRPSASPRAAMARTPRTWQAAARRGRRRAPLPSRPRTATTRCRRAQTRCRSPRRRAAAARVSAPHTAGSTGTARRCPRPVTSWMRPCGLSSRRIAPSSISMLLTENRGGGPGGAARMRSITSWMLYVPSAFRVSAMRGRVSLERVEHRRPAPQRGRRHVDGKLVELEQRWARRAIGELEVRHRRAQRERVECDLADRGLAAELVAQQRLELGLGERRHREIAEGDERDDEAGDDDQRVAKAPLPGADRRERGGVGHGRDEFVDNARQLCAGRNLPRDDRRSYMMRLNQSIDSTAASSASTAAAAANSAVISVSFFSNTSLRVERLVDLLEVGGGARVEIFAARDVGDASSATPRRGARASTSLRRR